MKKIRKWKKESMNKYWTNIEKSKKTKKTKENKKTWNIKNIKKNKNSKKWRIIKDMKTTKKQKNKERRTKVSKSVFTPSLPPRPFTRGLKHTIFQNTEEMFHEIVQQLMSNMKIQKNWLDLVRLKKHNFENIDEPVFEF